MPNVSDSQWDAVFAAILKGKKPRFPRGMQLVPKDQTWRARISSRGNLKKDDRRKIVSVLGFEGEVITDTFKDEEIKAMPVDVGTLG
jgi:hypothetical protein